MVPVLWRSAALRHVTVSPRVPDLVQLLVLVSLFAEKQILEMENVLQSVSN